MFTGRKPPWDKFLVFFVVAHLKRLSRLCLIFYVESSSITSETTIIRKRPSLSVFDAPDDFLLAEVGAVQERNIDKDVVVGLHDVLGLRAEYGAPLEAHHSLQSEVSVCILK